MKEYHKIPTVYLRSEETNFKTLMPGVWASPELEALKDITWIWTEKVDGTNIRAMWDGGAVRFGGKTDQASIPSRLLATLQDILPVEKFRTVFGKSNDGAYPNICLYGEGYGDKIQKVGSRYIESQNSFILFDVRVDGFWLSRTNVIDVGDKMGLGIVPEVGRGTLNEAIEFAKSGYLSIVADDDDLLAEGLIMKPIVDIFDRKGNRIIAKIKYKDFK